MTHLKFPTHPKKDKQLEKIKITITTKSSQLATFMKIRWNVLVKIYCINHNQERFFEKFHDIDDTFYIKEKYG
jgi:hypothetical protein